MAHAVLSGKNMELLEAAASRLIESYDVDNWWPAKSRFEVLVGAILVQNTRWTNVEKAIDCLREKRYLNSVRLSRADPACLQLMIRPAGCQSVKARRLRALARWVVDSGGMEALDSMATVPLRSALLSVHGVGDETADAILCFGFGRRVFIADKYARVWLSRIGLIGGDLSCSYAGSSRVVQAGLADSQICMRDLHAAIVLHAQELCRPEPNCRHCAITEICRYGSNSKRVTVRPKSP